MSDFLTPNSMIMLQQAMSFQWAKQRAISDNIVNAETPNYKVKYVTFEEALRKNIQAAAQDRNAAPNAMRQTLEAAAPQVRVAGDERARMDENGVNVAEQHIELVRSAYQTQHLYRAFSSDMSRMLMAIRGQ
ncbi:MAG: flagellar basal body rod protein FlgB [Oscillospiraceae bacterium]|nr:flagellar basal body rod protein FlgB [Oscillospiraceae bacterium]MCI8758298.1 flagellar basal body rod protein FlgB [Oscillospiraceae bacterium]